MTAIQTQKLLMRKALGLLREIDTTKDLFQGINDVFVTDKVKELENEYAETMTCLFKTTLERMDVPTLALQF